jgi:hypothetical protein
MEQVHPQKRDKHAEPACGAESEPKKNAGQGFHAMLRSRHYLKSNALASKMADLLPPEGGIG